MEKINKVGVKLLQSLTDKNIFNSNRIFYAFSSRLNST
jgi:hypothetical protein